MTGDISLQDNVRIRVGNSSGGDLQIYHDASNSIIQDAGTGAFQLLSNAFEVKNAAGNEDMITATENGAVNLYFDNDAKLSTVTGGVSVSGTITATTFSGSGASLTNLPAANITGTLPAVSGANLTNLAFGNVTTGTPPDGLFLNLPIGNPNVNGRLFRSSTGSVFVSLG